MKFESKFGIGEIVIYDMGKDDAKARASAVPELILEVLGIVFAEATMIICRTPAGDIQQYNECDLEGDPSFNQALGCYVGDES